MCQRAKPAPTSSEQEQVQQLARPDSPLHLQLVLQTHPTMPRINTLSLHLHHFPLPDTLLKKPFSHLSPSPTKNPLALDSLPISPSPYFILMDAKEAWITAVQVHSLNSACSHSENRCFVEASQRVTQIDKFPLRFPVATVFVARVPISYYSCSHKCCNNGYFHSFELIASHKHIHVSFGGGNMLCCLVDITLTSNQCWHYNVSSHPQQKPFKLFIIELPFSWRL